MEYIAELGTTAVVVWQAKHLYHAIRAQRIFKWSNKYPALNFIYTNSNETYNCVLFVPRAETVAAPWYSTEQVVHFRGLFYKLRIVNTTQKKAPFALTMATSASKQTTSTQRGSLSGRSNGWKKRECTQFMTAEA